MIVPITRKEKLLNAIATNGNVDFLPKTREELFLFKILDADVNTPTPITRKELLYQHIIDGTIPTFEPRTRLEKFIMVAAGAELELPVVLTREEYWWAEISDSAYETITGAIVHFISKRARAIKNLIANISYTQDLNGYSYPWPAGGGKNLLWLNNGVFKTGGFRENRQLTGIGTWVGMSASNYLAPDNIISYTIGDNSLTVTSKANGYGVGFECKLTAGQKYTLSWVGTNVYVGIAFYDGDGAQLSYVTSGASPKTFTVPESTANAIIVLRGDNANVTGEFSNVQLEEGQTATAYSPYANICPISGWTGANVTRTGKNLFDPTTFSSRSNYYDVNDDGSVKIKASDSSGWNSVPIISLKAGTYTVSINDYTSGNYQVETSEDNYTSPTHKRYDAAFTFTLTKDGGIKVKMGTGGATLPQTVKPILNIGYTAASYSPYVGNSYSITFPAAAGTVYGGTLDVTTGNLTVTHGNIASYSGETLPGRWISSMDVYSAGGTPTTGAQVVYELATTQTYQLTPTEVTTLLGDNTIWADTGDVSVTY